MWKQRCGSSATYKNLFHVFQHAGYQDYADIVIKIIGKTCLIMIFTYCGDYGTISTDKSSISQSTSEGVDSAQAMSLECATTGGTLSIADNTTLRNVSNLIAM